MIKCAGALHLMNLQSVLVHLSCTATITFHCASPRNLYTNRYALICVIVMPTIMAIHYSMHAFGLVLLDFCSLLTPFVYSFNRNKQARYVAGLQWCLKSVSCAIIPRKNNTRFQYTHEP